MGSQVDHFDTIFVSSEFEALILENSLIKQHQPHYNILLKDDKGYPFVRLSRGPYPRFTLANKTADDGARYFGPFGARGETRAAIDAVCAAFRLPTCTRRFPRDIGKERPCLNHHMGRCDGFCRGEPDAEEYQKRIEQACSLLSGHYKTLARELKTEMEHEAEQLHFEQAAVLRARIAAIEVLGKRQKVIAGVCADTDVWGLYTGAAKSGCAGVHVEDGSVTGRETSIFTAPTDETEADTLSALLSQYYLPRGVLPREILLPFAVDELSGLETVLTSRAGHRVTLRVPPRGEKAELLAMAERNARLVSVDRKAKKGDIAVIDFAGFDNGEAFEGGKGENYELELGSGSFVPGFEDQVIGMKAGEEKDIDITFPENYTPELAGKPVVFHVKVNEVKEKQVPAIDDEFAKDVSEFDTLKDLKADIKKKLTAERTESAQRAFEDVLMAKVAEGIEADIPEEMVELQAERMMEQFKQQLASQGIPFDQYLKMTNTAEADFRKQAQGPAADQVKMDLAVEAIIKAEGLEASDEDVESEMKSVAEKYGMDLDTVKKYLRPEDVKEQVIREKVVKLVADSAVAVAPAEEKAELEAEGEVVEKKAAKKDEAEEAAE